MDSDRAPLEFLRALRRAHRAVEQRLMADLHAQGYERMRPAHLTILRHLDPDAGSRTSELARGVDITRQGVSLLVSDLERLGIVEQVADPSDRRARIVRYTPEGHEVFAAGLASFRQLRRELDHELSADSVERLMAALEAVRVVACDDRRPRR